ncbi:MAG: EamA/RhaT family transporter, partial [Mucilaginibacter sp.]
MLYIFLSICFSVTVAVMLKLAKRYQIDVYQAITWNYSAAILLTWAIFRPHLSHLQGAPIVTYVSLGILLPILFLIIAAAIRLTGMVRTDAAQRLSLFIPVLAA